MKLESIRSVIIAAALALAPISAFAEGALVTHYRDCFAQGSFLAIGPAGGFVVGDWVHNRGDIRRTKPDGSGWVSLADGAADLFLVDGATGDIFTGSGVFSINASAILDADPCGGWEFDGAFAELHLSAMLTNEATGDISQWVIQAVVRNGVFLNFKVLQL